jgi:hypothetical protein
LIKIIDKEYQYYPSCGSDDLPAGGVELGLAEKCFPPAERDLFQELKSINYSQNRVRAGK